MVVFPKLFANFAKFIVGSRLCFELHEAKFEVTEDIYKRPLRQRHFSHLIERSIYFIEFGLMASKGKRRFYSCFVSVF